VKITCTPRMSVTTGRPMNMVYHIYEDHNWSFHSEENLKYETDRRWYKARNTLYYYWPVPCFVSVPQCLTYPICVFLSYAFFTAQTLSNFYTHTHTHTYTAHQTSRDRLMLYPLKTLLLNNTFKV
jgi:hypothetical protein